MCDLCLTTFCTGNVATGTALGTTTCTCFFTTATVTTGTGAVGTVAVGTVAAGSRTVTTGGRTAAAATDVVGGATGKTWAAVSVVSEVRSAELALLADPVPDCQPIAATMLNRAVAEAPAVMIFEVRAGIARFRFGGRVRRFWRFGSISSRRSIEVRGDDDNRGSIIAATPVIAATLETAVSTLRAVVATCGTDRVGSGRQIVCLDRGSHHAVQQVRLERNLGGAGLELDLGIAAVAAL